MNNAGPETLGYEREGILGTWFGDLLPPEKSGFRPRRSGGTYVSALCNGCIAYQGDGAFSHTVCTFQVVPDTKDR